MGLLNSLSNAWDSASRVVQGRPSREQEAAAERQNEHNQFVRQERTRRANLSNQQRLNEDVRAYIRPGNTANSEETEIYNRYAASSAEGGYGASLPPVTYHYVPNSGDVRNQLRAQGIDINLQDGNAMVFETGNTVQLNGQSYPVLSTSPFGNSTQIIQTPAGLRIREPGSEQFNLILPTDVRNTLTAAGITDFNGITELSGNTTLGGRSVRIATLRDGSAIALGQGNNSLQYKPAGNSQFINIREALSNTGMTQTEQRLQLNTETLGGAAGVTIRTSEGARIWVSGDNQSVRVRAPGQNQYFSLSDYRTQRGLSQRLTADLKLDTGSMPYIEGQAEEDEIGRYKYLSAADGSRVRVAVGPDGRLTLQPPLPGETHEQYDARMDLIQSIIGGQIDTINQDARTQAAEEAREQLRQDQAQSHYQQSRNFFANPGSATLGFLQDTGNTVGDVVNYALRDPLSAFRDSWISTGEAVVSLGQASWQGAQGWWDDVQQVTPQIANGIQQANANQAQRSPLEQALRTTAQVVSVTNPALGAVINPLLTTPEQRQQQAELFSYAALDMPEAASEAFLQDPLNNFPVLFGGLMVNQAGNVLPTATFRELGRQQVLSQTNLVDVTLGRYGYNSTFEAQERINALEDADQRILGATVSDAVNLVGELAFAAPPPVSAISTQADNVLLRPSHAVPDDYRLLGLEPGASLDEIRTAYRQQARQYHPDTGGATANPDRFTQLTEAYDRLRAQSQASAAPTTGAAQPPVQTEPVQEHPQPEAQSSRTEPAQTEVSSEAGMVPVAPSGLSVVEPVISTLAPVFTTQLPDAVPAFTLPQVLTQLGQVNSVLGQQLTFSQQFNGLGELPPADLNSPVLAPVGQGTPPTASNLGQHNSPPVNPTANPSVGGGTGSIRTNHPGLPPTGNNTSIIDRTTQASGPNSSEPLSDAAIDQFFDSLPGNYQFGHILGGGGGWRLYGSSYSGNPYDTKLSIAVNSPSDFVQVYQALQGYLQDESIAHKIPADRERLNQLLTNGSEGGHQRAIVIYARDQEHLLELNQRINQIMSENRLGLERPPQVEGYAWAPGSSNRVLARTDGGNVHNPNYPGSPPYPGIDPFTNKPAVHRVQTANGEPIEWFQSILPAPPLPEQPIAFQNTVNGRTTAYSMSLGSDTDDESMVVFQVRDAQNRAILDGVYQRVQSESNQQQGLRLWLNFSRQYQREFFNQPELLQATLTQLRAQNPAITQIQAHVGELESDNLIFLTQSGFSPIASRQARAQQLSNQVNSAMGRFNTVEDFLRANQTLSENINTQSAWVYQYSPEAGMGLVNNHVDAPNIYLANSGFNNPNTRTANTSTAQGRSNLQTVRQAVQAFQHQRNIIDPRLLPHDIVHVAFNYPITPEGEELAEWALEIYNRTSRNGGVIPTFEASMELNITPAVNLTDDQLRAEHQKITSIIQAMQQQWEELPSLGRMLDMPMLRAANTPVTTHNTPSRTDNIISIYPDTIVASAGSPEELDPESLAAFSLGNDQLDELLGINTPSPRDLSTLNQQELQTVAENAWHIDNYIEGERTSYSEYQIPGTNYRLRVDEEQYRDNPLQNSYNVSQHVQQQGGQGVERIIGYVELRDPDTPNSPPVPAVIYETNQGQPIYNLIRENGSSKSENQQAQEAFERAFNVVGNYGMDSRIVYTRDILNQQRSDHFNLRYPNISEETRLAARDAFLRELENPSRPPGELTDQETAQLFFNLREHQMQLLETYGVEANNIVLHRTTANGEDFISTNLEHARLIPSEQRAAARYRYDMQTVGRVENNFNQETVQAFNLLFPREGIIVPTREEFIGGRTAVNNLTTSNGEQIGVYQPVLKEVDFITSQKSNSVDLSEEGLIAIGEHNYAGAISWNNLDSDITVIPSSVEKLGFDVLSIEGVATLLNDEASNAHLRQSLISMAINQARQEGMGAVALDIQNINQIAGRDISNELSNLGFRQILDQDIYVLELTPGSYDAIAAEFAPQPRNTNRISNAAHVQAELYHNPSAFASLPSVTLSMPELRALTNEANMITQGNFGNCTRLNLMRQLFGNPIDAQEFIERNMRRVNDGYVVMFPGSDVPIYVSDQAIANRQNQRHMFGNSTNPVLLRGNNPILMAVAEAFEFHHHHITGATQDGMDSISGIGLLDGSRRLRFDQQPIQAIRQNVNATSEEIMQALQAADRSALNAVTFYEPAPGQVLNTNGNIVQSHSYGFEGFEIINNQLYLNFINPHGAGTFRISAEDAFPLIESVAYSRHVNRNHSMFKQGGLYANIPPEMVPQNSRGNIQNYFNEFFESDTTVDSVNQLIQHLEQPSMLRAIQTNPEASQAYVQLVLTTNLLPTDSEQLTADLQMQLIFEASSLRDSLLNNQSSNQTNLDVRNSNASNQPSNSKSDNEVQPEPELNSLTSSASTQPSTSPSTINSDLTRPANLTEQTVMRLPQGGSYTVIPSDREVVVEALTFDDAIQGALGYGHHRLSDKQREVLEFLSNPMTEEITVDNYYEWAPHLPNIQNSEVAELLRNYPEQQETLRIIRTLPLGQQVEALENFLTTYGVLPPNHPARGLNSVSQKRDYLLGQVETLIQSNFQYVVNTINSGIAFHHSSGVIRFTFPNTSQQQPPVNQTPQAMQQPQQPFAFYRGFTGVNATPQATTENQPNGLTFGNASMTLSSAFSSPFTNTAANNTPLTANVFNFPSRTEPSSLFLGGQQQHLFQTRYDLIS